MENKEECTSCYLFITLVVIGVVAATSRLTIRITIYMKLRNSFALPQFYYYARCDVSHSLELITKSPTSRLFSAASNNNNNNALFWG